MHRLSSRIFFSGALKSINIFGLFFLQIYLANRLNADGLGAFSLAMSWAQIYGILATLGIPYAAVAIISNNERSVAENLNQSLKWFCLVLTAAVLVWLLLRTTRLLVGPFASPTYFAWVMAFMLRFFVQEIFRAQQKFILSSAFSGVASISLTFLTILFIDRVLGTQMSIDLIILVAALCFLAASLVGAYFLWRNTIKTIQSDSSGLNKAFLSVGLPLLLNALFISQSREAAIIVSGQALTQEQLGFFVWGSRAGQFAFFPAMVVFPMLGPLVASAMKTKDQAANFQKMRNLTLLTVLASLVLALIFFAFADLINTSLAGSPFAASNTVLQVTALGYAAVAFAGVSDYGLSVLGKQKILLVISCISFLLSLPLTYVLARTYGPEGAALAFMMTMVGRAIICAWLLDRLLPQSLSLYPFRRT